MREEWIAAWEEERATCKFHGGPLSECGDDERDWYPQRVICWPTAQLEAAKRMYENLHEDKPFHDGTFTEHAEKPSPSTPFHYTDGISTYLAEHDVNPEDDFTTNVDAKPTGLGRVPVVDQQAVGDEPEPDQGG